MQVFFDRIQAVMIPAGQHLLIRAFHIGHMNVNGGRLADAV